MTPFLLQSNITVNACCFQDKVALNGHLKEKENDLEAYGLR